MGTSLNDELAKKALESFNKIQEEMKPIADEVAKMQKSLEPFIEIAAQTQKNLEPILKAAKEFSDSVRVIIRDRKVEREVMLESRWWLTPSSMGINWNLVRQALNDYKNGDKDSITNLFQKIYQDEDCRYLKETVDGWDKNSFFKSRMGIIEDALWAHYNGKYNLSVPALLAVAEGIATDYCKAMGIYKEKDESRGGEKIKKAIKELDGKKKLPSWLSHLDYLENAIDKIIYKKTEVLEKDKILSENILTRHGILHGIKTDYGTLKNSLQCFMLLDLLSELK